MEGGRGSAGRLLELGRVWLMNQANMEPQLSQPQRTRFNDHQQLGRRQNKEKDKVVEKVNLKGLGGRRRVSWAQ